MFQSDHSPDLPDGNLLSEIGIDARIVRCPERPATYPERGFARLVPDPAAE